MKKNFNTFTLILRDNRDSEPFYEFAAEDVIDTVPYFVMMSTMLYLAQLGFAV